MIESTQAYKDAITGSPRRIKLLTVVDISDPDAVYGEATINNPAPWNRPEELLDKEFSSLQRNATLELNRWLLDGSFSVFSDTYGATGRVGMGNSVLSDDAGAFSSPVVFEQPFSNVGIIQALSIFFSSDVIDGMPLDFTIEIESMGTVYYTQTFSGYGQSSVVISGFTVNYPDLVRVKVTKIGLPSRRLRFAQIVLGIYEEWDGDMLYSFNCNMQGDFSCLSLPYGTLDISMDNKDRRFEPRNKAGVFQSIEERQGIECNIGVVLANGNVEYKKQGVFYQAGDGWKTSSNNVTMDWSLMDIIGLISNRTYIPPSTLPTTLDGWVASVVAQLGENFEDHYHVDPDYADLSVTANNVEAVTGKTCGDILRWACMATGTWPRADAETGYIAAEPLWNQGNRYTLDDISAYPTMAANKTLAVLIFTLADGNDTQYIVSGNSTSSKDTVSISNPFIHNQSQALTAAKLILSMYGGNKITLSGRGDPASEIGDVDTVWLDESTATTGRRTTQSFVIRNGVLQDCQSTLLQADGSFLFENRAVITESGTWTAPAGVSQLRIIVVGGGAGGTDGTDGSWDAAGVDGVTGSGAKVFAQTISINEQQVFSVTIGAGGGKGQAGGDTVFGAYSSANGQVYEYGYTDIASGDSFGRTGVSAPLPGSGDGGTAGKGGVKGNQHTETIHGTDDEGNPTVDWVTVIDNYPSAGTDGVAGASGCVVVYWDKEAEV